MDAVAVSQASLDLEQRVLRLEQGLAQMQTERRERAVEVSANGSSSGLLHEVGRRIFGGETAMPTRPVQSVVVPVHGTPGRSILFETWAEARAAVRMFFDPRYRLSWFGRVAPLVFLAMILTSGFWFSWIPIIGGWVDKLVDLGLAYFLYKIVGHEAHKYRQNSPDLPASLRL